MRWETRMLKGLRALSIQAESKEGSEGHGECFFAFPVEDDQLRR